MGIELDSYCQTLKPASNVPLYSTTTDNASSGVGSSNASLEQIHHSSIASYHLNNGGRNVSGVVWPNSSLNSNTTSNCKFANNTGIKSTNQGIRYRPDYIRPPPPLPQRR